MALAVLLLLCSFWSLAHSQRVPYVSFMSQTLANHSYVDLSLVGNDGSGSDSVQCITDLSTCCRGTDGAHRGDWYFPDGTRLPLFNGGIWYFPGGTRLLFYAGIFESRGSQRVDLRCGNNANSPTGIYRCDIPTIAVHDNTDISVRDTVYVGLYTASGGNVSISGGVTYDPSTQTLTCISTGGPTTTVTWTRDFTTVTQGTLTVLNDPVTANYTHTLNVTGGLPGLYTCTVANNKPSSDHAGCIAISAHLPVTILPLNATTVKISWTSSVFFSTSFQYSSSFNASGLVITHYKTVLPRNTGSIDVSLDDEFEGYEHSFTLRHIFKCDQVILLTAPAVKFAFDKEYFQIQFGPFDYCLDWEVMKVSHIEHQLQSRLIRIIRENCAECFQLSPSFLRKGVFLCHGNPTKTTYRTTLVNPFPTTNSTHLVGIIQSWVSTGPSLILDGLLVRVSPSCPTSISSLDEEECETGTAHDPALGDRITQTLNVCALRNLGEDVCRLGGCPLSSG